MALIQVAFALAKKTDVQYQPGAQFTLEPGAEVLLAFVNGDPDLPLIVGSVYNGAMPAPLVGPDAEPNI